MPDPFDARYVVKPVLKALDVLSYVADCRQGVSLVQVGRALQLPKTTAFRYLQTLMLSGYVAYDAQAARYHPGWRLGEHARRDNARQMLLERLGPLVRKLAKTVDETVNLAVREADKVVYIEQIEPTRPTRMRARIGDADPLHTTALGKAILAHMPSDEQKAYLARPLVERTGRTLIDSSEIRAQLRLVFRRGFAVEAGENEDGAICVGVPILDPDDYPIAAISVSAPIDRLSRARAEALGAKLIEITREIRF